MSELVEIEVSEDVYEVLERNAKRRGLTVTEYVSLLLPSIRLSVD